MRTSLPLLSVLAACAAAPEPEPDYLPRRVVERERWRALVDGEPRGQLVRLEILDPTGPVTFYRVLDGAGRWVGHADANGRFSRRVPFEQDEQDVGVWSLPRGVAELLDADAPVRLEPMPVEAAAEKRR